MAATDLGGIEGKGTPCPRQRTRLNQQLGSGTEVANNVSNKSAIQKAARFGAPEAVAARQVWAGGCPPKCSKVVARLPGGLLDCTLRTTAWDRYHRIERDELHTHTNFQESNRRRDDSGAPVEGSLGFRVWVPHPLSSPLRNLSTREWYRWKALFEYNIVSRTQALNLRCGGGCQGSRSRVDSGQGMRHQPLAPLACHPLCWSGVSDARRPPPLPAVSLHPGVLPW